ncbi:MULTISPECIES: plasmid replication protein RepC [unclassified Rhizobium]|uniref:plasmid replication protein RepC n=1 Tax=unclassified Rhizobium TaxID=2613769 RepID=UPI0006F4BFC9|nr:MULTISPECIES: plasmid replication protein RepC [unclassified Rhizobium]KQV33292.1 replication initiation protein RepC [Rhizobium sp. Root1212]KRD22427.1 replication initiation protein RepC [Rhizobium sp. Root268]
METRYVSTPFGRRTMTLGMLASQIAASELDKDASIDKWKLFRALCEAKPLLGISDRALAVLNALLSFHPQATLSAEDGLVVFPSNTQLSLRTHGMAETTLRRHLASLVEAGLLSRKDSPNGKRYARKDNAGEIDQAFGFSLAPLLSRANEIMVLAAQVSEERLQLQRLKERFSLCRRDIAKLIETAIEERAPGDWSAIHLQFRALIISVPRGYGLAEVAPILEELEMLREEIVNLLELKTKQQKTDGNDGQIGRHIQNSNTQPHYESEPRFETKQRANPVEEPKRQNEPPKAFPLSVVLSACPEISAYGPGGAISSWRELMTAAVVVRSMLGVSPSAYQLACETLGPENAAVAVACIFERGGHINSPGGYLRDLTRRAERGEFSLGPMVMALLRANGQGARKAG